MTQYVYRFGGGVSDGSGLSKNLLGGKGLGCKPEATAHRRRHHLERRAHAWAAAQPGMHPTRTRCK